MSRDPVLVAGAGPVGLCVACVLAEAGLQVVVLEAEEALPENLRASTFHPPTLDMLERFGAASELIRMGLKAPRLQYRDRAGWKAGFDFGDIADLTQHPFRVQCEQFRLNGVLVRWLEAHGGEVRFGERVTGLQQDGAGVTAVVESARGAARQLRGSFLVGADGGRSAVREALGIRLEGFTWPERFLVVSTPYPFEQRFEDLCEVSYFADPDEWFFLLRVSGVWRAMFPTRAEESEQQILSEASVQARLARVAGTSGPFETVHRTLYSVHQRIAPTYGGGRVFLAGDAAHLNNPLGGMGMNGGIHDAFNLAGKLVRVLAGDAPASELDRYERQRRPVALEYVNTISTQNKKNLEARDPAERSRFREAMERAAADPEARRDYLMKVSMIASLRRADAVA